MPASPSADVRPLVDRLLGDAVRRLASDLHVEPTAAGYEVRYRLDGLLHAVETLDTDTGRAVVSRLMVMAQLLTYRLDIPQEGRLTALLPAAGAPPEVGAVEMRVSIMPTVHGLRAVVRLPAELLQPRTLADLRLPPGVLAGLQRFARADSGMLLLTGPAGSGKTSTIYALLTHILETNPGPSPGVSIITLEDPVERALPGVTQIEVRPFGELSYERALRSILRQDPQVLMLGEIRDAATASIAVQAALSGHRLISTLHAGTPGGALARLLEMGLEPYQIASALFAVVAQRLLRRRAADGTYRGRLPVAEIALLDDALRAAILQRADATALARTLAGQRGYVPLRQVAAELVAGGQTDAEEVRRILGE